MELRDYQKEAVKAGIEALSEPSASTLIVAPTGCHAPGVKILMADGSVKLVEHVRVGDFLMGKDSSPRKVLQLCRGEDEMFKIIPTKGEAFVVNSEHILHLKTTNEGKTWGRTGSEYINISVSDYIKKSKTFKHLHKLCRVAVNFPEKEAPTICPWIAGVLLGDGSCLENRNVSLCNPDDEVISNFTKYVESFDCNVTIFQKKNSKAYQLSVTDCLANRSVANRFKCLVVENELWGKRAEEKFVPNRFKLGSEKIRLQILAGLLDTDGHLSGSCFDFISKSRQLSEDVVFLSRSLGLAAYLNECEKGCQNGFRGNYWRVSISGNTEIIPTKVFRKQASPRKQIKSVLVSGFAVEALGMGDFFGFKLDKDHLYLTSDFIVHHNSGKSLILAAICQHFAKLNKKILVISHVKEILEQNAQKMVRLMPGAPISFYSASLRQKRFSQITFATIQSVAKAALPEIDILIIDEAHLVPRDGFGNYQRLIKKLGNSVRILGLTATPFRLDSGVLLDEEGIFKSVCYEIPILQLIYEGHLCPLISKRGIDEIDRSKIKKSGRDYSLESINENFNDVLINKTVDDIVALGHERKSWLVFCSSITHAERVATSLWERGIDVDCISSKTLPLRRAQVMAAFKEGRIKCLVGCEIFTTGFDAPSVDLIALLRPTKSKGLYCQILGRGMRTSPSKKNCLVLDYAGNIEEHGAVDKIRVGRKKKKNGEMETTIENAPQKFCPECRVACATRVLECPECGHEFNSELSVSHSTESSDASPLSIEPEVAAVHGTVVDLYTSKGGVQMVRVQYKAGVFFSVYSYFNFEMEGKIKKKAALWWNAITQGKPLPTSNKDAVDRFRVEAKEVKTVHYFKDKFFDVIGLELKEETNFFEDYGINI